MRFKKVLSVFLAAVMLFTVMSLGFTGAAAEIDYTAQYRSLAEALQNEHVRELTNYTVTNTTLDNETGGFDQEARGFAYDHRVVAKDNAAGDILKASNRFYFLAESLMSYKYGTGCYDASSLISYISDKIKPYFASTSGSGEIIYEDFYGNRYYPTAEEVKAYKNAVRDIQAVGAEVSQATLTEFGIYFMEMNDWEYYNIDAVLKYFVGNVLKINTGNWYHRFSFIVETSVDNILEECNGIESIGNPTLTIRTAVYEISYQKEYNESKSKAYFSFAPPSLDTVFQNYAHEFGWTDSASADLTKPENGFPGLLREGQASAFMIKVSYDNTTVPYLLQAASKFDSYVSKAYDESTNTKWDSQFVTWDDNTVNNHPDTPVILGYAADLANNYSNDTLKAVFGKRLGNMVTLAYLFKTSRSNPTRTVRGTAQYVADEKKLDDIIHDLDALVSPREGDTDDVKISNRVATVVSMFLDVGNLLGIEGEIDYSTLEDLIGKVLQQLVFSDSIINMLVELLYPLIVGLIVDNLGTIDVIGGVAVDLVGSILKNNNLAIYPNTLGDLLINDHGDKYRTAATILRNGGDNWENVNCAALVWGVDDAPAEQKAEVFIDALCAALGGFTRLLVTMLCGDAEYEWDDPDERFGKNYDLKVIWILDNVWLASQGLYTKLFIPLYRVLGLEEHEFLSSAEYHAAMENNFKDCLKLAVNPIIEWVFNHVAKKPIETIMKLVPNLVHFLSRQGGSLDYSDDWANTGHLTTGDQKDAHSGYSQLQTHSLYSILHHVHLKIVYFGQAININGSIGELIGDGTLGMLTSLNALLNEVIEFSYDTDEIYSENIACYSDAFGNIVLPDSTEYALNPGLYPNAHMQYWADASNTQFSLTEDKDHPFLHNNITYVKKPYYIPSVPEAKLISCGTINPTTNTVDVEHPGLVFKFLLRYVISALGYRYDLNKEDLPTLIECFGLDTSGELFMGLTLSDILDNVMLHPDEAICALLELFYSNEEGNLYEDKAYTYPVTPIDYHEAVLLNQAINPTLSYGAEVKYSKYWTKEIARDFVSSLSPLAEDVLIMLGLEGMEDGLGPFLENLLNENVFNNDLINTLFNTIYQLLSGLNESVGIDIEGILAAVLDVNFTPITVARAVDKMMGFETEATRAIKLVGSWQGLFDGGASYDPITGEYIPIIRDVELDWGLTVDEETGLTLAEANGISRADAFLRTVSALLSPAAFILKFLFMDYDLSILGLINLPSYAGYQYAFIGLLEALACPDILTYDEYYRASLDPECGDANVIYHLFSPLLGLLDKVYANPVDTLLNLLPNLLFFISVGGLSDFVNNLIHFAYVLLDILKPILNGYDLLGGLLANLDIGGLSLNLSLPLDIDVNSLISDLLGTLVGDVLTIEGVSLHLPYIDLYTICVGTLEPFLSKEQRQIVHLSPAGGGELLTALLRIVFDVLFMEENHKALSEIVANLAGEGKLDAYDEETLYMVINGLIGLIEDYEVLDIVLYAVYMLITTLVPIADTLAIRLQANNMTITDLIDSASDMDLFVANLGKLLKDPNEVEIPDTTTTVGALAGLFARIKALFDKIMQFFRDLFNFA
ncbi:MAG: hypothetical protein IKL47_07165 [Clostridia bacterium]|nr:hypothetical protein [Clostridia bacterium]